MTYTPGHHLKAEGPTGDLSAWRWYCECGKWEATTPAVGSYGNTSSTARISQVRMAHGKHARAALANSKPSTPSPAPKE